MRQVLVRCKASKAHDVVAYFGFAEKPFILETTDMFTLLI